MDKDLANHTAGSSHGPWRISLSPALSFALPNATWTLMGLPSLSPERTPHQPNRRVRTVRTVVWEGRSRKAPPYPDRARKGEGEGIEYEERRDKKPKQRPVSASRVSSPLIPDF